MDVRRIAIPGLWVTSAQGLVRRPESRATEGATTALLVEDVLGLRLRQRVAGGRGICESVVPHGRPARRGDARRLGRLPDMLENPLHRRALGDEGDDADVGPAVRTGQRQGLEQAREPHGPQVACRSEQTGCVGSALRSQLARWLVSVAGLAPVGGGGGAERRVRRQYPVVAMTVQPRGRNQGGQAVDELQRREGELRAPIAPGLRQMIDDLVRVDRLDPFQGERRAGAVAQHPAADLLADGGDLLWRQ